MGMGFQMRWEGRMLGGKRFWTDDNRAGGRHEELEEEKEEEEEEENKEEEQEEEQERMGEGGRATFASTLFDYLNDLSKSIRIATLFFKK